MLNHLNNPNNIAQPLCLVAFLQRHILSDMHLNCFDTKERQEGRGRGMIERRTKKGCGEEICGKEGKGRISMRGNIL